MTLSRISISGVDFVNEPTQGIPLDGYVIASTEFQAYFLSIDVGAVGSPVLDWDSLVITVAYDDGTMPDGSGWGAEEPVYGPGPSPVFHAPWDGFPSQVFTTYTGGKRFLAVVSNPPPSNYARMRLTVTVTDTGGTPETRTLTAVIFFATTYIVANSIVPAAGATVATGTNLPVISWTWATVADVGTALYKLDRTSINLDAIFDGDREAVIIDGDIQEGWSGNVGVNGFTIPVSVSRDTGFPAGSWVTLIGRCNDLNPDPFMPINFGQVRAPGGFQRIFRTTP